MTDKYEEITNNAEEAKEENEKNVPEENNEGLEQTKDDIQNMLE